MAKRSFDMSVSKQSLQNLYKLERAIEHYPNRVRHAIQVALETTEKEAHRKLGQNYGNNQLGKDNVINIETKSSFDKAELVVKILRAQPDRVKQSPETKGRFDANIKMYGRKRYVGRKYSGEDPYRLKEWEKGPDYAFTIRVPAKSPNQSFRTFILYGISKMLRKNLNTALRQQGIGVRGGISRITGGDVPR
jgi:hypothetical protein